ncbi:unnamed protein product [marine sediment metagenome]|uniref:Uncharacterized protein n=1 Tax=marine sediment metagenome TaxID=412755 RepID=X1SRA3_9ZZZZ
MATLRLANTVVASTTEDNIIAGSKFEFPERNVVVRVYAVADLTGANETVMDCTFGNVIAADSVVLPKFTDSLGPNRNEHMITRFVARAGQRIQIKLRETLGVNSLIRTLIDIDEIA